MPDFRRATTDVERETALHSLRFVLVGGAVLFVGLVVRNTLAPGENPWIDPANLALLLGCLWWLHRDARALRSVSWLVFASFTANIVGSVLPLHGVTLTPTHLLLPLLVLYGVLLADLALTAAAVTIDLTVIGYSAQQATSLTDRDVLLLSDLAVSLLAIAALSLGVRSIQRELLRRVHERGLEVARQLEANQRLNATIFHDIANPLTALLATLSFAEDDRHLEAEDLESATRAARRISAIIDAVREMNRPGGSAGALPMALVDVDSLSRELHEVFAARLRAKEQTFEVVQGAALEVYTNSTVVCNSVLANFVSNAIKFSPRGARISLAARREGASVHIAVRDAGQGFPPEALREQADSSRAQVTSHVGTEREHGFGVGLRIAQHYLRELDGALRIENRPEGGAEVTAILPMARAA